MVSDSPERSISFHGTHFQQVQILDLRTAEDRHSQFNSNASRDARVR